jgi:hypothetical protein
MRRTASSALLILAFAATMKAKTMTENQKYLEEARQRARAFEAEMEPERLREAYMALENVRVVEEHDPKLRAHVRSNSLSLWLHLLQLLDRSVDPGFNSQDVPTKLVQPPPTRGGVAYSPGADPALIDDPNARAEYEKAIAANRKKSENYRLQVHLRPLNERISERAEAFIRSSYASSKRDQEELRNAIDKIIKDPHRKASLQVLLDPHNP